MNFRPDLPMLTYALAILLSFLFTMPQSSINSAFAYNAQDNSEEDHNHQNPTAHSDVKISDAETHSSIDARPQMVRISPSGVMPAQLNMQQSDSIVFFYNDTIDDLVTLEVEFGSRTVHCASALKIIKAPGLARSRKPFGPKEFASTCFHEKGTYPYKIYTSRKGKKPLTGTVTVQ